MPSHAIADEILHALSNEGLLEELGAVTFFSNQFVKPLDLVAEFDGQGIGLKLTGIPDGFHAATIRSRSAPSLGFELRGVGFTLSSSASAAAKSNGLYLS